MAPDMQQAGGGLATGSPGPAPAGDALVRAACVAEWPAHKADCSAFVRAVGLRVGATVAGDANGIVAGFADRSKWTPVPDGPAAAQAASQGHFVVAGLSGGDQAVPDAHGHVVVVVTGQLNRDKYPHAFWGRYHSVGAQDQTINYAWTAADRDNVVYARYNT